MTSRDSTNLQTSSTAAQTHTDTRTRSDPASTPGRAATIDWFALQKQSHHEFGQRVARVEDWDAPTPASQESVGTLVRHVVQEQQWIPPLLAGLSLDQAQHHVDPLGDDLAAEWRTHSAQATQAWQAATADAVVQLSYDSVTVMDYLREQVSEVTIHSWDLARATLADETIDDALIEAVWSVFDPERETLEASGLVVAPAPLPADARLQSRLLALIGRDERR